mgnify:CR=1 FL=1
MLFLFLFIHQFDLSKIKLKKWNSRYTEFSIEAIFYNVNVIKFYQMYNIYKDSFTLQMIIRYLSEFINITVVIAFTSWTIVKLKSFSLSAFIIVI